jgi:rhodanese-related sulfurtransferase
VRTATVAELEAALPGATLLDVREPFEFAGGHVEGATNAPMSTLDPEALPPGELWLICRSGSRSASAARTLQGAGRSVVQVQGGMGAWRRARLPVVGIGWPTLVVPLVASLTLGLAPFSPEPHLFGKLRWLAGGASGMGPMDAFDLLMHGAPWLWLAWSAWTWLRAR